MNHGYISVNSRKTLEILYKMEEDTLKPLDWECAGEAIIWIGIMAVVSLVFICCIENNVFVRLFRPVYKPIQTCFEMINESLQVKKAKKNYDIRETAGMEDYDFG